MRKPRAGIRFIYRRNPDDRVREHDDSWKVGQHPSENVLAAYLDGGLTARERSETEAHLEGCDACRAALADTVGVLDSQMAQAGAPAAAGIGPGPRPSIARSSRRNRATWLVAGATLAASIAGIAVLRSSTRASPDVESPARDTRPGASDERIQELPAIAPRNDETGLGSHLTFIWARKDDADHYSFRLLGEDGATIWSRDVADTTLALPADVALARGRSYFWRVDAMSAGIVASTRTRRFSTAP